MEEKTLKKLEFDKIIHILTSHAASAGAKELCRQLTPMDSLAPIEQAQRETADALLRIYRKGSLSFGGIRDIRDSVKRLEIGGVLGMGELLQIMSLLETAKKVKHYGERQADEEDIKRDSLDESFELLEPLPALAGEIRRCILSEEEMADDASAALSQIRRSMRQMNDKVHNTLNAMVNGDHHAGRTVLSPGQSRAQKPGARYDSRPKFHRLHTVYRAFGRGQIEQRF